MIGRGVNRVEDGRLLRGAGRYVDDLSLPGTVFVGLVRSVHAHARLLRIEPTTALSVPGVRGVYTLADLPELRDAVPPPVMNAMPTKPYRQSALADGVARFVGEAIAVVVADSQYAAADGAEAVGVEYQTLPPVTDAENGRRAGASLVHPAWGTNVAGRMEVAVGDVDAAFAASDLIIAERFEIGRMAGLPLEPRGVLASWDPITGTLTIWSSTQMPYGLREYVTSAFDLPRTAVRVIAPDVGGGFGPKGAVYGEDFIVAALTRRLARPVKWIETRRESLMATVHGHDQIHTARLGLTRDGGFTALEDTFLIDNGAYLPRGARTANNVVAHLMGPYRFPAFRAVCEVVATNKVPNIPFRGAGRLRAVFVTERLVEIAARRLGIDPLELRRRNLLTPAELPLDRGIPYRPGLPVVYDSGDYPALVSAAAELIDYEAVRAEQRQARRAGRLLGCAIIPYVEGTGVPPAEGAMVTVSERGQVTVAVGAPSQGQGHETTLAQICAERLGVPIERVTVVAGDTARFPASPVSSGTFASRVAVIAGNAVALAADEVRDKSVRVASQLLECAPEDVVIDQGVVHVKGAPDHRLALAEVALAARGSEFLGEQAEPGLSATRYYLPPAVTWAAGAHAAVVEISPDTGRVRVVRYAVAHDAGREINPVIVQGQVHGGVAQGLGSALLEEIVYDADAQLLTGTLMDYAWPRADSFPDVRIRGVECPSTVNPLGIKGAGEGATIPGQAIIANAVADALGGEGSEVNRTPVRAEDICRLFRRRTDER